MFGRYLWRRVWFAVTITVVAGCTSLPDTSGYTNSTIQIKVGYSLGEQALLSQWDSLIDERPEDARRSLQESKERFENASIKVNEALAAMVAYADSIDAITEAGNTGAEAAQGVADAAESLLRKIDVLANGTAASAVFGTVADAIAFAYGEIAKARAARELEESLSQVGPAMIAIAATVEAITSEARLVYHNLAESRRNELEDSVGDLPVLRSELYAEQSRLALALYDQLSQEATRENISDAEWQLIQSRLDAVNAAVAGIEQQLAPYEASQLALAVERKAGMAVFTSLGATLAEWSAAHDSLVAAVKNRKAVTMQSLVAAATDLQQLAKRVREL